MENLTDSCKTVARAWRWKSSRLVLLGEKDNQKIKLRPDGFHGYCLNHDMSAEVSNQREDRKIISLEKICDIIHVYFDS